MKLETFFDKFELFADAPNAVQKMRELVLDFAIGGRLLRNSESEKIDSKEEWPKQNLGNIVSLITKGSTPTSYGHQYEASGIPFVKVENIADGAINRASMEQFISEETHQFLRRSQLEVGDILFSIAGTIGKTCVVRAGDVPANTNQALAIIRGFGTSFEIPFLKMQLDSFVANKVKAKARGGAMPNVSLGDIRDLQVVVPPLAEQKRIVAKVDELMALCDRLEAQQNERQTRHTALARAAVSRFADAPTPANLEYLFHPSYAITPADLRKTILTLAVQGKLVPQDPSDEPAENLLLAIRDKKRQMIARKEIGRDKDWPVDEEPQPNYELPSSWIFTTLSVIGVINPRNDAGDDVDASFVPMKLISAEFNESHAQDIRKWSEIKSGFTHFAEGDVSLAKITPCFENRKSTVMRNLANGIGAGTTELHVVRPIIVEADYILIFLKSPIFVEAGVPRMTGTAGQKRVPTSYFAASPFPLPPLAEQKRIVAKVDELMKLVDQLEAQLAASTQQAEQLMHAMVAELIAA